MRARRRMEQLQQVQILFQLPQHRGKTGKRLKSQPFANSRTEFIFQQGRRQGSGHRGKIFRFIQIENPRAQICFRDRLVKTAVRGQTVQHGFLKTHHTAGIPCTCQFHCFVSFIYTSAYIFSQIRRAGTSAWPAGALRRLDPVPG